MSLGFSGRGAQVWNALEDADVPRELLRRD